MDIVEKFASCPFCGGTDIRRYGDNFVGCHPCGIAVDTGHCVGPEARKDSAHEWNKRVDNAEITRLRARLAEAEAVIKPFADFQRKFDVYGQADGDYPGSGITIGNLRAAAKWMEEK